MFALVFSLWGCIEQPAEYQYGVPLQDITFHVYHLEEGIYPSQVVLDNPNNPFERTEGEIKWDIESHANPAARFYSWATNLAFEATGEHQFYTAEALSALYRLEEVPRAEMYYVWQMAIDAYQSILDNFPQSVSYTEAQVSFPLAPLAYDGILNLGGEVQGGWTTITDADGTTILIQQQDDGDVE